MNVVRVRGFTLLEMMIVVVIIGILATIAYPSYQQYVLRANRAEGQAMLNDAAAREERHFAQNNAYVTDPEDIGKLGMRKTTGTAVMSDTDKYSLAVSNPAGSGGYLLTATPQGAQARDTQCGSLTLNAVGERGKTGSAASAAECWR
ncbi:type IV pilin protein [Pseudomonas schmalbachii]|uniref:Type IV pilin protein n=1 Tax=Pseudomonas schmalbachii TaxID=2816993 RepID=A0ABS3TQ48_9PSED|nr:type IV pilin protein [Pseudomonas schmalbachii]MBO3275293.1 type IV pilin protein [Pseudomonas schmalbachii]